MSIWIHWNIQWLPGPEIKPGTPATLVRSSTAVLPSPISTVHIAPTSTLNSLRPRKLPQIFLLTEVNLSFPGAGHGTICRMRNEQVHTMKTYDWTWNRTRDQYNSSHFTCFTCSVLLLLPEFIKIHCRHTTHQYFWLSIFTLLLISLFVYLL